MSFHHEPDIQCFRMLPDNTCINCNTNFDILSCEGSYWITTLISLSIYSEYLQRRSTDSQLGNTARAPETSH